jgi:uncharacterized protein (TIGR02996 family)
MGHLRVGRLDQEKNERRLESWKEIASFFERDEKTVRRWERDLGLPVHRLPGVSKGRVYGFAHELAQWSNRPRELKAELALDSAAEVTEPILALIPSTEAVPPAWPNQPGIFHWYPIALVATCLLVAMVALGTWFRFRDGTFSLASVSAVFHLGSAPPKRHIPKPEAERLYLEGRYYWNERTSAGLTRALDDFTQAIVLDPQDARAYAGLADTYNLIREYTPMPEDEAFPRAETAARKAIELDPNLAEGHRALAFPSFWWRHDTTTARREFERAIAINPNDATSHLWYANALMNNGENDKAVEEINRAQELDPSSSSIRADKGLLLYCAGRRDEALVLLRQMKRNEPDFVSPHRYLAQIYLSEREYPGYLKEAEETARLTKRPDDQEIVEAEKKGFAHSGARGMLQGLLNVQKKLYEEEKLSAYTLAQTSAMLGDKAGALRYLRTSRDRHESAIAILTKDTVLRNLHDEPGYRQLAAEVGFPPTTN